MSEEKACAPFSAGELVLHIAGGPLMACIHYESDYDSCKCTWIWRGKKHTEDFRPCELKRPDAEDLDVKDAIRSRPEGSSLIAR
jgi:uncharacterized protein YodC (DUF2158 family)